MLPVLGFHIMVVLVFVDSRNLSTITRHRVVQASPADSPLMKGRQQSSQRLIVSGITLTRTCE